MPRVHFVKPPPASAPQRLVAHVSHPGVRRGWHGRLIPTLCLRDLYDAQGQIVADHAWVDAEALGEPPPAPGTLIQFTARWADYSRRAWEMPAPAARRVRTGRGLCDVHHVESLDDKETPDACP